MWQDVSYDLPLNLRAFTWRDNYHSVYYAPRKPEWADITALAGDDEIGGWSVGD